ncbi:hypothetical protein CDO73_11665 [Saccharibacillus sp. O23]|uniref:YutD family protein n=1 Tax=Saccharibacillus sp. O23 TaxID=2009338 RepID=UPI000B4E11B4|nr:YutD family protein [Saccharibacillus sp. O23]OWR30557.1 hypothetical protein CDO73_11665 [Saccharibacillus sp. O23]
MFQIGGKVYEVMINHKNGWNPEVFRSRYSEILERYDYIVGDWGYNQLRLKGMYRDGQPKTAKESQFSFTTDYITEHCNFGCAYFVLRKVKDLRDVKDPEEAASYPDLGIVNEPREYRTSSKPQEAAKDQREHPAAKERKEQRGRGDRETKNARGERSQDNNEREPRDKNQTQGQSGKKHANRGERPNREHSNSGNTGRERDKDKAKASGGESNNHHHHRNRKREDRGGENRQAQRREGGNERRENASTPNASNSGGQRPDQETAK